MSEPGQLKAIAEMLAKAAYPKQAHYALAALQDVRALVGDVPAEALPLIAQMMGMDVSALSALMQDSAQFQVATGAAHRLRICQGAVCIGKGGGALLAGARESFADRAGLAVEAGHCMGLCAQGPAASLDGEAFAPADAASIRRKVESLG